ncbi:2-phospho-L-lactate guanylyltransferase [Cryobacterium sp. PH31-AA6]|uniref:2-phospho-L-lactate guanylyltransferase n=1 Tax=Cryobacterium sp. PH31-AA6 TaxID=3046205 RepID=UPI0024B8F1D0|nr:2-phospho-L-lactate guanylyltransferase [Cryobacterium sp. PH31-AA6]MDJ0325149.1 2-phospho-L-lactate guanylyltransferase [Cryobacterium sp. PH31-AA6]
MSWICVVPVKGSAGAKSRLGDLPQSFPARGQLAEAFALDTVAALLATSMVEGVLVVTADLAAAAPLAALGAQIVAEEPGTAASTVRAGVPPAHHDPLNAAVRAGIRVAHTRFPHCNVAVLTGDLPALTVADVETTLAAASAHARAMVADEEGTGTTTLLARAGLPFTPRFGPGSRATHEAAGHVPLDLPATASIRRDVDTVENLAEVLRRGVGSHTSALIAASQVMPG